MKKSVIVILCIFTLLSLTLGGCADNSDNSILPEEQSASGAVEEETEATAAPETESMQVSEALKFEYEIGDFGYWNAGPDLAIFYDDIYEQTIVEVIPLGHAETGVETMRNESRTVRLELLSEEGEQTENE